MSEARFLPFGRGRVTVFSARCPDKESPNEDGAALIPVDAERGVLVVADGLGGRPAGESAAGIALRCLKRSVAQIRPEGNGLRTAILDALDEANQKVMALGIGAGTTVAVVEINGTTLRPYHVGDSAIFIVGQRAKIKVQTVAHSPVGYAVESGMLDETEAMHHEERHIISNMLGASDMRIEVGSPIKLAQRDTVLLATDGLFDNLSPQELVEVVRTKPLPVVARRLVEVSKERMHEPRPGDPSKHDDLTFIVFRLDPAWTPRAAVAPADASRQRKAV